VTGLS
jgi:cytochrome c oxidase assembly protein subunit 11